MEGQRRDEIAVGTPVGVVLKADQASGRVTWGVVAAVLTKSAFHPHGIKVRLEDGQVGRVKEIGGPPEG